MDGCGPGKERQRGLGGWRKDGVCVRVRVIELNAKKERRKGRRGERERGTKKERKERTHFHAHNSCEQNKVKCRISFSHCLCNEALHLEFSPSVPEMHFPSNFIS